MIESPRAASQPAIETATTVGYYGLPVIHRPHWRWLIIGYFFLGGISGSAAAVGGVAQGMSRRPATRLAQCASLVSLAALAPCPILLILDLGRPARFLNMLRVFRVSSPMSVGTWGLTAFGAATGLNALLLIGAHVSDEQARRGAALRSGLRIMSIPLAVFGTFLAGYTGVLLAATAVPLWSKRPHLLGPLFFSSAVSSGLAAIDLTMAAASVHDHAACGSLHDLEAAVTVAEGMLLGAWLGSLGEVSRPLREDHLAGVLKNGVVGAGMVLPLALSGLAAQRPRFRKPAAIMGSLLTLGGVFALRYVVVEGGRRSADDPESTFAITR